MVIDRAEIAAVCDGLRSAGKKVIFTNGCFDILHAGHVRYLTAAKQMGDCLVVGVNTDRSVRELKGESRPINAEQDRAEVLAALRAVDYVVLFDELTAESIIGVVRPAVYVKGGDYTPETLPEAKAVQAYGGAVAFVPLLAGRSSTKAIRQLGL